MSNQELIEFNPSNITAFDEFESQLAKLKSDNEKLQFDYEDKKGNKEARSHVHSLRQAKSAVEQARKKTKDRALTYGRAVDGKANQIKAEIEEMIDVHAAPLKAIEDKEKAVQAEIQERIESLNVYKFMENDTDADTYREVLKDLEAFVIDDSLGELVSSAAIIKDKAIIDVKKLLKDAETAEAEKLELDRLRKEKEERDQADREARIAQEAAEKASREAAEKAESERIEREESKAREDKQRELEAKEKDLAIETAKRVAAEAETRAANAEKEAKEKAKLEQEQKIEAEKLEAEKREANKKHQAKINNESVAALVKAGLSEDNAKTVVTAIAKKLIPNIHISY